MAYSDIYATLGDDVELPHDNPALIMQNHTLLGFKVMLNEADTTQIFGDLPDINIEADPFNPTEASFLTTFQGLSQALSNQGLTFDQLLATANQYIEENVTGPGLQAMPNPLDRIGFYAQNAEISDARRRQIEVAAQIGLMASNLGPANLSAIDAALARAPTPAPATTETRTSGSTEEAAETEEEREEPLVLANIFSKDMRYATLGLETTFFNSPPQDVRAPRHRMPDQYLDHDTRHRMEEVVVENFRRYGAEYYTQRKAIIGADANDDGKPDNIYTFDKSGNIFAVEQDAEGQPKRNDDGTFVIIGNEAVGHITHGLHVTDKDGYVSRPHEATALFMEELYLELTSGQVAQLSQDFDLDDEVRAQQIEARLDLQISLFFDDVEGLEEEYRGTLQRMQGMDVDVFLRSDLARRMREAKNSDADVDAFIFATFLLEADRVGTGEGMFNFRANSDQVSSIRNLLRVMSGDGYDPRVAAELRDDAFQRDNILSLNAYETLRRMPGGAYIAVESLYESDNPSQKAAVLAEFGDATRVTREQVEQFVRRQFDLRAIETLSDAKFEAPEGEVTPSQLIHLQNEFIRDHADVLDTVSQAMAEGRFNPYEDDVHLVFKAFVRPTMDDPELRVTVDRMRQTGSFPPAAYALNHLNEAELRALTGDPDIRQNPHWEATLERILNADIDSTRASLSAEGREAYDRLVINYYEPTMANHTWWRNGEVNDNTPDTWNGRYGEPNQDQLMHMYMRYNWFRFDQEFGENAAHARKLFFNENRTSLDYNVTYDEVVAQMSAEERAVLDKGIADLNRPSMYMYLLHLRLDHYRDLRTRHYIPSMIDKQLAEEFARTSEGPGGEGPGGNRPPPPPPPPPPVINNPFDPTLDPVEEETDLSEYNLGLYPVNAAIAAHRTRTPGTITTPDDAIKPIGPERQITFQRGTAVLDPRAMAGAPGLSASREVAVVPTQRTNLPAVIPGEMVRTVAPEDGSIRVPVTEVMDDADPKMSRAWRLLNHADELSSRAAAAAGDAALENEASVARRAAQRTIESYGFDEARVRSHGARVTAAQTAASATPDVINVARTPSAFSHGASLWGSRALRYGGPLASGVYAFSEADEGGWTVATRGSAAVAAYSVGYSQYALKNPIRGTVLVDGLITAAEVGIHLQNKDGEAASAATIIGGFAMAGGAGGAALGSPSGPGAIVTGAVGSIGGAVVGTGVVLWTPVEEGLGRWYNEGIYNGRWWSEGLVEETRGNLQRAEQYRQRIESGQATMAELAVYKELLEDLEDDLIDLQNTETGLANNLSESWNSADSNADGQLSEAEAAASADYQLLYTNRYLQTQIAAGRARLEEAYDNSRHGQLNALFEGVTTADQLESRLQGEFSQMAQGLGNLDDLQIRGFWNTRGSWNNEIQRVHGELAVGDGGAMIVSHLTHQEIRDLRRDIYHVRAEVEDRIQNLIYEASRGKLSNNEFTELQNLRTDLQRIDEIEAVLMEDAGPLGLKAQEEQKRVDFERARTIFEQASNGGRVDRATLRQLLNTSANADIIRGRGENWFGQGVFQFTMFGSHTNKAGRLTEEYERMSMGDLTEHKDELLGIEEELEDRIYNLMLDATQGELSDKEARELGRALEIHERLETVKSRFSENATDLTRQTERAPEATTEETLDTEQAPGPETR